MAPKRVELTSTDVLPGLPAAQVDTNYDFRSLTESMRWLETQRVQRALAAAVQPEPYTAVLVHPGLGALAYAFSLDTDGCEGIYTVAPPSKLTTMFLANVQAWQLDEFVQNFSTPGQALAALRREGLLKTSVVFLDVGLGAVPELQQYVSDARAAAVRAQPGWQPPAVQGKTWREETDYGAGYSVWFAEGAVAAQAAPAGAAASGSLLITEAQRAAWKADLFKFLRSFLSNFIQKPSVDTYLTPDKELLWVTAFTQELVDPDLNYEVLEYTGDRALELAAVSYLKQRFPTATKSQYHDLKQFMVSKDGLKDDAVRLGLAAHLLTYKTTVHTREDVFESFMGALVEASDQVLPGLGYVNAYNFVVWAFNQKDISVERNARRPAKTLLKQIFEKIFTQGAVKYETSEERGTARARVSLEPRFRTLMQTTYGKTIPDPLGEGTAPVQGNGPDAVLKAQKAAEAQASETALKRLEAIGVTVAWADAETANLDFKALTPQDNKALAEKASRAGYPRLSFLKPTSMVTKDSTLVALVGTRADGKRVTLALGEGMDRPAAFRAAASSYLSS